MGERLLLWAFRMAWRWLPRVPESIAHQAASWIADLVWLRNGPGIQQLQRNLGRVTVQSGEPLRLLVREAIRKYAHYWQVLFQLSGWPVERIQRHVVFHNLERVEAEIARGKGVILAATHSGNWDLAGIAVARRLGPILTVAERLRPEGLFNEFMRHRESYGIQILPHRGGPRPPLDALEERLRDGGLVALVSDRDLSRRGVDVSFFDAPARMAAGPAMLALTTGAALVPCAQWVSGDEVHVLAHEPMEISPDATVESVTQRLADVYARDIAAHPADWHMLQVVWREDMRS